MEITISEPAAEKVLDTCVGVDNRRYYKIQWQATWEPEEEIVAKYENLVQDYWKETESTEIEAGRSFINTLFEKLNEPEGTEPAAKKAKEDEETEPQKVAEEVVNYNIQSFYKEVNSPEHKIADEPPTPEKKFGGKPPPLWPWDQQGNDEEIRPFKCDECTRSYITEKKLKDHKRKLHTNLGTYQCSVCPKIFPTKRNLQNHMNRHTGVGPHACPGCAKRFMTPQEVDNHKRSCNKLVEKEFQCEICSKRFATKTHLAFHTKIHLPDEEKPFKCQYCPRTFAYNHDCVHHMRLHIGDKPYKCDQCDSAFHRKSYLTEHMFLHTGISKYRCQECLDYFKTQQMLQTHVKNVHILKKKQLSQEEKNQRKAKSKKNIKYKCEECGKEFRFMKEFHYHQVVNHKEAVQKKNDMEYTEFEPTMVYKCKKCDKTFVWPSALKKHAETHRFEDLVDKQHAEMAENNEKKMAERMAEAAGQDMEEETGEDKENQVVEGEENVSTDQPDEVGKNIVVVFTEEKDDSNQRVVISVEAANPEMIQGDTEVQLEEVVSPEDENSFTCGYCYSQFGNEFSLNVHMLEEHHKHRLTEQEQQLLREMAEVEKTNLVEAVIVQASADEAEGMEVEAGVVEEVGTETMTAEQQLHDNISSAETLLELNNAEAANIDYIEQL